MSSRESLRWIRLERLLLLRRLLLRIVRDSLLRGEVIRSKLLDVEEVKCAEQCRYVTGTMGEAGPYVAPPEFSDVD